MTETTSDLQELQHHTILIVDDTPANLETLYSYFESAGFEIMMAQSGPTALKRVEYMKPDIILLDVVMPGMDGFETCRRLKAVDETRHIPVIFMTALNDTVHKIQGFKAGAADYITKPFQLEEVLARVDTHLALRNLQCQLQSQNEQLQVEIRERHAIAAALQAANDELENRVDQRTAELAQANASLKVEISERRQAEVEIRKLAAELSQRVENRTNELAALYEVTALVSEPAPALDTILNAALHSVLAASRGTQGTIHLAGDPARLLAQVGFTDPESASHFSEVPATWIIAHNQPLSVADIPTVPLPPGYTGVPIRGGGQVLGALSLRLPPDADIFVDPDRISLLSAITDHIGIVVETVQLRQTAEQSAILEERSRLARELHDSVKQQVFATAMQVGAARALMDQNPEAARTNLAEAETLVHQELAACGAFLVEFNMNAENQIRVFADMLEGHISIDQLKKLSRAKTETRESFFEKQPSSFDPIINLFAPFSKSQDLPCSRSSCSRWRRRTPW